MLAVELEGAGARDPDLKLGCAGAPLLHVGRRQEKLVEVPKATGGLSPLCFAFESLHAVHLCGPPGVLLW